MKKETKNALVKGAPLAVFMCAFFIFIDWAVYGFPNSLFFGILSGVLCEVWSLIAIKMLSKARAKKFQNKLSLLEDERIIKEGPLNRFRKIGFVGGWAYLTDKRFVYKSLSSNVRKYELFIPLQEIMEAKAVMTTGIIPTGLKLTTVKGDSAWFVAESRKDWINEILDAKMKCS